MDTIQFLREATALAGVPGQEGAVADYIANAMRPLCDSVEIKKHKSKHKNALTPEEQTELLQAIRSLYSQPDPSNDFKEKL